MIRKQKYKGAQIRSVETDRLAHGRFQVKRLDVLPVLFQQRDEEVDAQHGVGQDLIFSHLDMADSDTQAKNLLELELDRRTDFSDLVGHVLSVVQRGGELSGFGKTGSEETRDLLDKGFGSQERIVLLGQLLYQLSVPVQLLEIVSGHVFLADRLSTINVGGISEDADRHPWPGHVGEFDGSRETLIPLGIVVLQTDLQLDRLDKVAPLLAIGICEHLLDAASHA
jgi:hypothetical protein